jgi:DNA modification methylase
LNDSTSKRTDNFIDGVPLLKKIKAANGDPLRIEEKQLPLIKELIERFINFIIYRYSSVGDLVFDPFFGTGTTIDAAIQLRRLGAGCDESKECCHAATKRLWATAVDMVKKSK